MRQPIRFGIGVHGGEVIIGDIGYRDHIVFTALGDAVNVAARLQDMTKTLACEAIVSEEVCRTAGLRDDALPQQEVAIRGRDEPMVVHVVADTRHLAPSSMAASASQREARATREVRPLSRLRERVGERVSPQRDNPPEERTLTRAFGATSPASGRGAPLSRLRLDSISLQT